MKRIFLALTIIASVIPGYSQEKCYASFEKGKLVIGNDVIERTLSFGKKGLKTVSLQDKINNTVYASNAKGPDFDLGLDEAATPEFNACVVAATAAVPAHFVARLSWKAGNIEIRREYRLYDGTPAIGCDTYLRGSIQISENKVQDSVDAIGVENQKDLNTSKAGAMALDRIQPGGKHWHLKAVEFRDVTDANNNLVTEVNGMAYRSEYFRGNILFAKDSENSRGLFFLKEAPCSHSQIGYPGSDFIVSQGSFQITGLGFTSEDLASGEWIKAYSCVTGVYDGTEFDALKALRTYQRNLRSHLPDRDEMIMMNTWGDRSKDTKVNEKFCLEELEKGARLGITHFQIDDGWQSGKGQNSAFANGSYKDIYKKKGYWSPDPQKYPSGLETVVKRGRELGIEVGLWFAPSAQNEFEDWEKDAETIIGLHKRFGVRVFKVDGWTAPTKKAEANFRRFVDKVMQETGCEVLLNLDSTAQRRQGYHMMCEYGNIFLENRYTDWTNYFPYKTLRNLWMLSKYVPSERLQVEFLNKWRNTEKYGDDRFAPANYSFDYLFAITMAGQPLAWMEAENLPEEAYSTSKLIRGYREIMAELHSGLVLPIGEEPSGESWTGFQSILSDKEGYFIVYREDNGYDRGRLRCWCPEGAKIKLEPVLGSGRKSVQKVASGSTVNVTLPQKNSFAVYKYSIQ